MQLADVRTSRKLLGGSATNVAVGIVGLHHELRHGLRRIVESGDVPVAEVSELPSVRAVRAEYEHARQSERRFL